MSGTCLCVRYTVSGVWVYVTQWVVFWCTLHSEWFYMHVAQWEYLWLDYTHQCVGEVTQSPGLSTFTTLLRSHIVFICTQSSETQDEIYQISRQTSKLWRNEHELWVLRSKSGWNYTTPLYTGYITNLTLALVHMDLLIYQSDHRSVHRLATELISSARGSQCTAVS